MQLAYDKNMTANRDVWKILSDDKNIHIKFTLEKYLFTFFVRIFSAKNV